MRDHIDMGGRLSGRTTKAIELARASGGRVGVACFRNYAEARNLERVIDRDNVFVFYAGDSRGYRGRQFDLLIAHEPFDHSEVYDRGTVPEILDLLECCISTGGKMVVVT